MGPQGFTIVTVPLGHPGDAGVSQVVLVGPPGYSCISVAVEPQGDTVMELTISGGGSRVTLMPVVYLCWLHCYTCVTHSISWWPKLLPYCGLQQIR